MHTVPDDVAANVGVDRIITLIILKMEGGVIGDDLPLEFLENRRLRTDKVI